MYRSTILLIFGLLIFVGAGGVLAQEDSPSCNPATVAQSAIVLLRQVNTQSTSDGLDVIRGVISQLNSVVSNCSKLTFQGNQQKVIGPITISEGIYRARVTTTEGNVSASLAVLDGECGGGSGVNLLPSFFIGAHNGEETIFTSHGCETLIEVSNRGAWELTFTDVQHPSTISALMADTSSVYLGDIVSALDVDRDGCPGTVTSRFSPSDAIYVVAYESQIPRGTRVFVRLYLEDSAIEDTDEIVAEQDYPGVCVNFVFENSRGFEVGAYAAEFFVNGNSAGIVNFAVR